MHDLLYAESIFHLTLIFLLSAKCEHARCKCDNMFECYCTVHGHTKNQKCLLQLEGIIITPDHVNELHKQEVLGMEFTKLFNVPV